MAADPAATFAALRQKRVAAARQSVDAFCELVLHDEQTGAPLVQAPLHREWHRLADQHDRLVLWAAVEHGKSVNLSVARTLWELGRDPTLRFAIVSNTATQATKLVRTIREYIERNELLHAVFPDLRPATPWTDSAITVRRPTTAKEASVAGFGVHGAVLGARLDRLILDDILDFESTRTPEQRQATMEWITSTLLGRLTERGRVIVVGTAFHPDDVLHRLAGQGWPSARFPAQDDSGTSAWAERWSPERLAKKRVELGPMEASRQLDCLARSDDDARIKSAWIEDALARGEKASALSRTPTGEYGLLNLPPRYRTYIGVDLAVSAKTSADLSAIVTILRHTDGTREVLEVLSGRWTAPEIIDRIVSAHRRFMATSVVVESNAAQWYVGQWLKQLASVPVIGHTTGRGQMSLEFRVEQLATLLARGQFILPAANGKPRDSGIALLARDLLFYSPSRHCPDRVAALAFADFGCERGSMRVESFPVPWLWQR